MLYLAALAARACLNGLILLSPGRLASSQDDRCVREFRMGGVWV